MRRRPGCLSILAAAAVLAVVAVLAAAWWIRTAPSWYAPPDRDDPEVAAFAETVEYRVVEEMQRIRTPDAEDPGSWTLRVREGQVNAWLATRLPTWLAREDLGVEWPETLGPPQVHLTRDGIDVGLEVRAGALAERVVVARILPALGPDGLGLELRRVGVGRAGLSGEPLERLLQLMADLLPRDAVDASWRAAIEDMLAGGKVIEPRITLSDGRVVEVIGLRLESGMIDITSRTR